MTERAVTLTLALCVLITPASAQRSQTSSPDGRRLAILAIEYSRAANPDDLRALLDAARGQNAALQAAAVRALGRLERRDVITDLLGLLGGSSPEVRAEVANALAQSLHGEPLADVPGGQQEKAVQEALLQAGARDYDAKSLAPLKAIVRSLGRLTYDRPEAFKETERFLRRVLDRARGADSDTPYAEAARGLESLARVNHRLAQPFEDETQTRLRTLAIARTASTDARRNAMAALVAAQGADADTVKAVLNDDDPEVRRQAVLALAGAGTLIAAEERIDLVRDYLGDRSFMVRLEAVRGWVRRGVRDHGCQPLLDALNDDSLHVVLAALDALADSCAGDDAITDRLVSESRTPPPQGSWQRQAHAFVAMAKRAPDRAEITLPTFATHQQWAVRMYAARAAALMNDVSWLTRLAADADDNVAEAALPALRKRLGAESDAVFAAALGRKSPGTPSSRMARPYQVIRVAANELKGAQSTPQLVAALADALQRVSADQCDTSRDVRLALIERLGELGSVAQVRPLMPLVKDVDPLIAQAAAALIGRWTGSVPDVAPTVRALQVPVDLDLSKSDIAIVEMASGRSFRLQFFKDQAPLAVARFISLAKDRYYDGSTFHRVVANFVIQGGSPNANEFCGDCPFMRDELGLLMHTRGTVGISTRGRDTGDAQIFVNLVDNSRLDHEYTVFAAVCGRGMEIVDEIAEADRITRIVIESNQRCQ